MNKTISVNIGGRVFNIEERAYDILHRYLSTIRSYFSNEESTDEIISDIELRIAELFMERINAQKQVITEKDVDEVIAIMGKPEDFVQDSDDAAAGDFTRRRHQRGNKRVFRDPDNKIVLGVCSGISAYFGIDPIILRAVFAIAFVFYGSGLLLYLILAVIIPKAKTTAEKLQMHGEPVTVENISRKVSESFNSVKEDIKDFGKKNGVNEQHFRRARDRSSDALGDFFDLLGRILTLTFTIIVKIIGVILIIAGVSTILASTALLFGWEHFFVFMNDGLAPAYFPTGIIETLFSSGYHQQLFTLGLFITLLIPAIAFLMLGIRMLATYRRIPVWIPIVLTVIWFAGVSMLGAGASDIYRQFRVETSYTEPVPLTFPASDTLYIDVLNPEKASFKFTYGFNRGDFFYDSDVTFPGVNSTDIMYMGETEFTIQMNRSDSLFHLELEREAKGFDQHDAVTNAESIVAGCTISGDSLRISRYFAVLKTGKFRNQECKYILSVPVGKAVHFTRDSRKILDDIPNTTHTYDADMTGHTWTMTAEGLSNSFFEKNQKKRKDRDWDDD